LSEKEWKRGWKGVGTLAHEYQHPDFEFLEKNPEVCTKNLKYI